MINLSDVGEINNLDNSCYYQYLQQGCKTVNLVNTLGLSREMLNMNKKSHVICYVLTLKIFDNPKKLRFWQNSEEVLNWLNFASWFKLHRGHMQESRGKVMCRSQVQDACKLPGMITIYKWAVDMPVRIFSESNVGVSL